MSLDKKKGKKGKKMPMEPEDEEIGKKKRGHSSSPATPNKKAKTSGISTPTKKNGSVDTRNPSRPRLRKRPTRQSEANEVHVRRLEKNYVLRYLSKVMVR